MHTCLVNDRSSRSPFPTSPRSEDLDTLARSRLPIEPNGADAAREQRQAHGRTQETLAAHGPARNDQRGASEHDQSRHELSDPVGTRLAEQAQKDVDRAAKGERDR